MSKTFYIKNTTFNDVGVGSPPIVNPADSDARSFIIGPGELNGPAGLARDSDLELYGYGALKWGEGVNQNQYRQLENFACPQKETGDYWALGSPPEGAYVSGTHPITPKDENDLGIGNGITTPLEGQNWYNTTQKIMYTLDTAVGWVSSNKDDVYVNITGDTMTGNLIFGAGDRIYADGGTSSSPGYAFNGNVNTGMYSTTTGTINFTCDNIPRFGIQVNGVLNVGVTANYENLVTSDNKIPNKKYVDDTTVSITGDTMTGNLIFGAGNRIYADGGSQAAPGLAFANNTGTGLYQSMGDYIKFAVAGTERFEIENDGTLNVAGTTNYELLVTSDDDIPNKKYVETATATLSNKSLESPVINTQVTGTAIKDEDNMVSNSDVHLATQRSIKAYVDSLRNILVGELGTYALLKNNNVVVMSPGDPQIGSDMSYASAGASTDASAVPGVWRCMGQSTGNTGSSAVTLWYRIS